MPTITSENLANADRHLFEEWKDGIYLEQLQEEIPSGMIPSSLKTAALLNLSEEQAIAGYQAELPPKFYQENKGKLKRRYQHASIWAGLVHLHLGLGMPTPRLGDAPDNDIIARLLETYPHRHSAKRLLKSVSSFFPKTKQRKDLIPKSWKREPSYDIGANSVVHRYREPLECWHIHFGISSNFTHDRAKALSLLPLPYVAIYFDDSTLRAIFRVRAINAEEAYDVRREIQSLLTPFGITSNKMRTLAADRTIHFEPHEMLFFDPDATLIAPADRVLPRRSRHPRLPRPPRPRTPGPPRIT